MCNHKCLFIRHLVIVAVCKSNEGITTMVDSLDGTAA